MVHAFSPTAGDVEPGGPLGLTSPADRALSSVRDQVSGNEAKSEDGTQC